MMKIRFISRFHLNILCVKILTGIFFDFYVDPLRVSQNSLIIFTILLFCDHFKCVCFARRVSILTNKA